MASPGSQYKLQVTAGPGYDGATHQEVVVNGENPTRIETEHARVDLYVRIRDYTGLPSSAPRSHGYFSHPNHVNDQYSISVSIVPKRDIPGDRLVFGNDFDHPIRDRLPPGSSYALQIVKWAVDPGIEADLYGDKPYLYGAALSSWSYFRICGRVSEKGSRRLAEEINTFKMGRQGSSEDDNEASSSNRTDISHAADSVAEVTETALSSLGQGVIDEGGEGSGQEIRAKSKIPELPEARKRHFLQEENRKGFVFEEGRVYMADFGNPYLGFNDLSLRLPGFSVKVAKYIDMKNHTLRYVLKNNETDGIFFVVLFRVLLDQNEESEGSDEGEDEDEGEWRNHGQAMNAESEVD